MAYRMSVALAAALLAGVPAGSALAQATADWQQRIGDLELPGGSEDFAARAEAILGRLD